MIEFVSLIYSLSLPWLLGYLLLMVLKGHRLFHWPMTMSLAFGLGFGVFSHLMLLMGAASLTYNFLNISLVTLMTAGILVVLIWFSRGDSDSASKYENSIIDQLGKKNTASTQINPFILIAGSCFIFYYLFYIFWSALSLPVYTWDSIATTVYNAKIIFYERSLPFHSLAHPAYPLQIPLILSWISFNLGYWDDQLIKIIFPVVFVCFIFVFWYFMRSFTNKNWSLLGLLFLFSSNFIIFHATISYRDIFMMFYNCVAIFLLLIWKDQKNNTVLTLAALFAGLGTFIKLEGTAYLLIHIVL